VPRCNCNEIPGHGSEPESVVEGRAVAGSAVAHASVIMITGMMSQTLRLTPLRIMTASGYRAAASGLLRVPA